MTLYVSLIMLGLSSVCSMTMTRCRDGAFMTDPESCSHYYVCDHGRPVRFACGEGTYYSPDLQTCDHKGNVDCGDRPRDSDDRSCNNGDYNNGDYNNDKCTNNGSGNNEKCPNNEDNVKNSEEEYYLSWTDEGTMYKPLQMNNNDVPASAEGSRTTAHEYTELSVYLLLIFAMLAL